MGRNGLSQNTSCSKLTCRRGDGSYFLCKAKRVIPQWVFTLRHLPSQPFFPFSDWKAMQISLFKTQNPPQ